MDDRRLAFKGKGSTLSTIALIFFATSSSADCLYKPGPPDALIATADNDQRGIASAWYGNATEIYAHGVLGDAIEAQTLYTKVKDSEKCASEFTLDDQSVFEDITPRIADVTGDGKNNVIVIESHITQGASLAIYGLTTTGLSKIASTPYIGQPYRWLAPVGIADFNADGVDDVAYVQTPHIGGTLKIWSFKSADPVLLAQAHGFSNHRIGDSFITGGIINCTNTPTMVLPDQHWSRLLGAVVQDNVITTRVISADIEHRTVGDAVAGGLTCP